MAKRMGRPPKEIDKDKFEEMCAIQCTEEEIAAVFEVHATTLCKWCKKTYKKTFAEVFAEKRQIGFYSLRSSGWKMKDKNPRIMELLMSKYLDISMVKNINIESKQTERDPDYQTYRIRKSLFKEQREVFDSPEKHIIALCSRRSGKTVLCSKMIADAINQRMTEIEANPTKEYYFVVVAKTYTQAASLYWLKLENELSALKVEYKGSRTEGKIYVGKNKNAVILLSGSDTIEQVEKLRGNPVAFFVIDEAQSQKYCRYLLEDILLPATSDFATSKGILIGTPPRAKGTTFERIYRDANNWGKYHWNMSQNIYLPDYENILEKIKAETGLSETDPIFRREYLGELVYDTEALVYRLTDKNYYDKQELLRFVEEHSRCLELLGGIDYGFSDSDAISVWLSATDSREKYLIFEFKQNHLMTDQIIHKIKEVASLSWLDTAIRPYIQNQMILSYDCGGGGSRISKEAASAIAMDLSLQSNVVIRPAYKVDKGMSVDLLRKDVNAGYIKVPKGGIFDREADSTVWKRDKDDKIIYEIDDDAYHPDLLDTARYAIREKWAREQTDIERMTQVREEPRNEMSFPNTGMYY